MPVSQHTTKRPCRSRNAAAACPSVHCNHQTSTTSNMYICPAGEINKHVSPSISPRKTLHSALALQGDSPYLKGRRACQTLDRHIRTSWSCCRCITPCLARHVPQTHCICSMLPQHRYQRQRLPCNRQEAYLLVLSCVNLAIARSSRCRS